MAFLCLAGIFFVAYKVIEEEYVLLKAGSEISVDQWRSFRMAKLAARNCCAFMAGVSLFFITGRVDLNVVLSVIVFAVVMQFSARIIFKIRTRLSRQNPF